MAAITTYPGNADFLSPELSFDITSVTAKRVGPYLNYYSFNTDGTMLVIHTRAVPDAAGVPHVAITGWDHFSGADLLQSAVTELAVGPFLTILNSRNPSSTRAFAYLMGGEDSMTGSAARDVLHGLGGNDVLAGGAGADALAGGAGNDALDGGTGRDRLQGQAGDDILTGGLGADRLGGGTGADHFVFRSAAEGGDAITDFVHGADKVVLDAAGFGLIHPLTEGVDFIAAAGATAAIAAASVLYDTVTGNLLFDADGTGAGAAVLLATLTGAPALALSDLLPG